MKSPTTRQIRRSATAELCTRRLAGRMIVTESGSLWNGNWKGQTKNLMDKRVSSGHTLVTEIGSPLELGFSLDLLH